MNQLIELLWNSIQLGAFLSIPIMAIHWAATHTWVVVHHIPHMVTEAKGLVLYKVKLGVDTLLRKMAGNFFVNIFVNLTFLLIVVMSGAWGLSSFIPETIFYHFPLGAKLSLFTGMVFAIFIGKPIQDTGEAIFNCNRCMPSVWVGLPTMIWGVTTLITSVDPTGAYAFPYAILMVCITSFFTTMIGHIVATLSK